MVDGNLLLVIVFPYKSPYLLISYQIILRLISVDVRSCVRIMICSSFKTLLLALDRDLL